MKMYEPLSVLQKEHRPVFVFFHGGGFSVLSVGMSSLISYIHWRTFFDFKLLNYQRFCFHMLNIDKTDMDCTISTLRGLTLKISQYSNVDLIQLYKTMVIRFTGCLSFRFLWCLYTSHRPCERNHHCLRGVRLTYLLN